ncbi:sulfotransferase [Bradyrhizobium sp. BWA-3-5]|uniref:nodulation protein NoeE n=1 Tax=Bradyrhizobium sp. BWA-3-5 TaxID=3080013 RepID=UPI00293E224D|nr:sulfotransferase [Bradyrhizobium sp. BWA-3-5]WOH64119.1 sulfotransferase [Bradyrhizobium sp. BWA-3-5]WOH64236.1 sulfotransferase [Bradyrhizobium sp. BWA-3-5]WOH70164.1 sulfotransferase [Bradyrhizobium sp. BWA-3-5]
MSQDIKQLPTVCFLLGLPRSGTTLLAHLLQQHPDIAAPPEPWLMLALEAFGRVDHRHPAGAPLIHLATSEFLGRIDRNIASRAFADAAYGQYLAAAGKRTFVDKTPRNWLVLEFLDSLYPEAPRILLMRNPYAIAASLKSTWGISLLSAGRPSDIAACLAGLVLDQPVPGIASSLADIVLGLPTLAAHRGRRQTQVVQYEVLVARPDEEIRRVIAGLGYGSTAIASATVEQADYLRSSTFGDRKILEKKTIDERSVQAWQSELSIEEMQVVTDLVGADLLKELGYEQDLRYAQQAGVVDKGREVTEGYRQLFSTCKDLLGGRGGALFGISAQPSELNSIVRQLESSPRWLPTPP